ncbi:MAG: monovalent cation:proton antiporter-2 (CPA2) family protein [Sulfurimicrobium sp.]|jgi:CPA2 family monovalent cation:H+ antiporter-2|nr:monovalent cation:proton antiporter-2 (CPA2) family protein [Sulfurimicrobium sp.]MDZ7656666.1 monovalent cation:proton antiporter-2 (CPA2) family protein [Sulfurimicrobium sp.]
MPHDAPTTLQAVLVLLGAAVFAVALFRSLRLPPLLAYLLVGMVAGPHALGWIPDTEETRYLAEFGVVFLMFSIGLEFSLPQLKAMRGVVFGLGGAQVLVTLALVLAAAMLSGLSWQAGVALGGVLAMSSTAIVSKMMAERLELQSRHGLLVIGVLLFQDLAVVPLLILIPALSASGGDLTGAVGAAFLKAVVLLIILLYFGQNLMRRWFHWVARHKSSELFMLNVLLVTLGLAYLTGLAGLSLALGAFLAGMLISETEYRYQVEADIQPFRDVLLGLFFVTVGMLLDMRVVAANLGWVALALLVLVLGKGAIIALLSRLFRHDVSVSLRTGLFLAQAGEFGFVLMALANGSGLVPPHVAQIILAAMLLSMVVAPFLLQHSTAIVTRLCRNDWNYRALELHDIVVKSAGKEGHVIVCGYGRSGQNLSRFLDLEGIPFFALDLDPQRVRAAAAAGENVVYGDASRREVLMAAGLQRARAVVVSYADTASALKVLHQVHELRPDLPVVVRTLDDSDLDLLQQAGAAEVVPEVLEGSLMLASHALMLLGVPLTHVLRRIREVRSQRYGLFRGVFRSEAEAGLEEHEQPRLVSVALGDKAASIDKSLADLQLDDLQVEVTAIRRRGIRGVEPSPEMKLMAGDVVVLLGTAENLVLAETRLLQG